MPIKRGLFVLKVPLLGHQIYVPKDLFPNSVLSRIYISNEKLFYDAWELILYFVWYFFFILVILNFILNFSFNVSCTKFFQVPRHICCIGNWNILSRILFEAHPLWWGVYTTFACFTKFISSPPSKIYISILQLSQYSSNELFTSSPNWKCFFLGFYKWGNLFELAL